MPQLFQSFDRKKMVKMNIERVRNLMKKEHLDAIICNSMDDVRYLTGFSTFHGVLWAAIHISVFTTDQETPTLYTLPYMIDYVKETVPWIDVQEESMNMPTTIQKLLQEHKIEKGRIGLGSLVSYGLGKALENTLPYATLINSSMMAEARSIKNDEEIKILSEASAVAEMGMNAAIEACNEGVREYEVAAAAEYAMRNAGAEAPAFSAIVMSGENASICKELSTDKRLRRGDLVLIDQGALYEGYNSEFARTAIVGTPTKEQKEIYSLVLEAEQKTIQAIKPGAKCSYIDGVSRKIFKDAGYERYTHKYGTGHGLGTATWEAPSIDPSNNTTLQPGMFVAVEPGIHKRGFGGIRIEDNILVTEHGPKVFTKTRYWDI